jgi:5-methylcytosine-specific restriction endonuclease McrA
VKKYNAARYLAKRDQLRTQVADWQRANRVRVRFNTAEYSAKNPELRRAMKHRRRALALAAGVVQFSPNQWHERLKYFGSKCWMCGGPFEHIDHVKPLSRGGPHMLANLRPSCARCNLTKRDKWFGPLDLARFTK